MTNEEISEIPISKPALTTVIGLRMERLATLARFTQHDRSKKMSRANTNHSFYAPYTSTVAYGNLLKLVFDNPCPSSKGLAAKTEDRACMLTSS